MTTLKIAVTGASGLFGAGLVRVLGAHHNAVGLTRAQADITDAEKLAAAIASLKPDESPVRTCAKHSLRWLRRLTWKARATWLAPRKRVAHRSR
jgi:NAD(P)-dependent dehydrogenase (short-subunit alcohol dehydrogenase family)